MKNLVKLFEILGEWKYRYITAGLLLIISVCFRLLEPKVLQVTVDKIIYVFISGGKLEPDKQDSLSILIYSFIADFNNENRHIVLLILGIVFLSIALFRGLTMLSSSTLSASATEKAMKHLRDRLFRHIQYMPMEYFSKTPTGELIQRCTGDVETIRKFATMQVTETIRLSAVFIGAFIMMFIINPAYAFITISFFPVMLICSYFFYKKEKEIWTKHEAEQDKLTSFVQENLSGIRVVKAFVREEYEIERFRKQNETKREWGIKLLKLHSIYWPGSDVIVYLQLAISIIIGGYFVFSNQITVGEYTAFFTYSSFVTWPMRRLAQLVSETGMTGAAIERIYSILEEDEEKNSAFNIKNMQLKGDIVFKNVYFKYPGSGKYVLNGTSFHIKAGQKVAILGPTGSGKSTIISLLMRFYEPERGEILIDGVDIRKYPLSFIRSKIGVTLQKPYLFSTTIKENIAYSKPDTHIEEITESAKIAHVDHVITNSFPKGYESLVGEKGVTLSGGQKQRVTIARTVIKNPDIIVFDDSTSSVDTETESEIKKKLSDVVRNKTLIVIAHRITSVKGCDKIIILENGKVTSSGTHEELISTDGFYKKIYEIQISVEDEIKLSDKKIINLRLV
ncbi:MAG: ABC transporter ATP-binding protein/permease [Ignavibacteria bacterium]|nr:ABC transporter ATP-binding protein/permease [Ignavibacteria bacterium]